MCRSHKIFTFVGIGRSDRERRDQEAFRDDEFAEAAGRGILFDGAVCVLAIRVAFWKTGGFVYGWSWSCFAYAFVQVCFAFDLSSFKTNMHCYVRNGNKILLSRLDPRMDLPMHGSVLASGSAALDMF